MTRRPAAGPSNGSSVAELLGPKAEATGRIPTARQRRASELLVARPKGEAVLANRTMIGAFAARPLVLRNPDLRPPRPRSAPKARALPLRYTPAGFVLAKRMCFGSAAFKVSLAALRCYASTPPSTREIGAPTLEGIRQLAPHTW